MGTISIEDRHFRSSKILYDSLLVIRILKESTP